MANTYEDERRRRQGVQLTPEREEWLIRAMAAERAGQPMPPLPTQRVGVRSPGDADYVTPIGGVQPAANQGREALAPAYVDPRSQAMAQAPALVRPIHSMLDKIMRPGRAGAAGQMNREYLENALKNQMARSGQRTEQQYNQARGRSTTADAAMKELQLRAMSGDDPEALKALSAYSTEVTAKGRGGGGPNDIYQRILEGRGEGGEPIDPVTGRIPTRRESVGTVLPGDLTLAEAQEIAPAEIEKRQAQIAELEKEEASLDVAGATRLTDWKQTQSGPDWFDSTRETVPIDLDWRARRKQEIPIEKAALQTEIRKIENEYSNIQAGAGSATVAPAAL
jgi:hypothetical protein